MYARNTSKQTLTFDFAEGLVKNNLLIVDRETNSIWSQLDSKAISGPLKNTPLKIVPSIQTTWQHWRSMHPNTQVLMVRNSDGRPYLYRNWTPGLPRPKTRPKKHDTSNLGLGLVVNGQARYFPLQELDRVTVPLSIDMAGRRVTIHYKRDAFTAWAEDADGKLLTGVLAYENGWLDFFPNSEIFTVESSNR